MDESNKQHLEKNRIMTRATNQLATYQQGQDQIVISHLKNNLKLSDEVISALQTCAAGVYSRPDSLKLLISDSAGTTQPTLKQMNTLLRSINLPQHMVDNQQGRPSNSYYQQSVRFPSQEGHNPQKTEASTRPKLFDAACVFESNPTQRDSNSHSNLASPTVNSDAIIGNKPETETTAGKHKQTTMTPVTEKLTFQQQQDEQGVINHLKNKLKLSDDVISTLQAYATETFSKPKALRLLMNTSFATHTPTLEQIDNWLKSINSPHRIVVNQQGRPNNQQPVRTPSVEGYHLNPQSRTAINTCDEYIIDKQKIIELFDANTKKIHPKAFTVLKPMSDDRKKNIEREVNGYYFAKIYQKAISDFFQKYAPEFSQLIKIDLNDLEVVGKVIIPKDLCPKTAMALLICLVPDKFVKFDDLTLYFYHTDGNNEEKLVGSISRYDLIPDLSKLNDAISVDSSPKDIHPLAWMTLVNSDKIPKSLSEELCEWVNNHMKL